MAALSGTLAYLVSILTIAAIYSILALGVNLQWGYTGLFNVGVAAFWGIGAYATAIILLEPGGEVVGLGLPLPFAFLAAMLVAGLVALLIGIPTLKLRQDYLAIATLGMAEIIRLILLNESWLTQGGRGITVNNPIIRMEYGDIILLAISLAVLAVTYWFVERSVQSPWGRVLMSIREDEDVAKSVGKDVFSFKMISLIIGSMIMAVAGVLMALRINYLVPAQFIPEWTFYIWIALIIGGSGTRFGPLLGGVFLAFLFEAPRFLSGFLTTIPIPRLVDNFRLLAIGIIIIIVMTYRPHGLLGEERPGGGYE